MVDHPGQFIIIVVALSPKAPKDLSAPAPATWAGSVGPATCAGNVGPRSAAESLGDHQRPGGSLFWTLLEQGPASE